MITLLAILAVAILIAVCFILSCCRLAGEADEIEWTWPEEETIK